MPAEINFSKGVDVYTIPGDRKVLMPVAIERSAGQRGVLSDLVSAVLKRDIEINEALK